MKDGNISRKYILLDSLLFKLRTMPEKETALLAIPETCANKIKLCTILIFINIGIMVYTKQF